MVDKKVEQLRAKLIKSTREKVQEHYKGRGVHAVRAVTVIEDLDSVFNLLFEDVREWYGVHFPELEKSVRSNEIFLKLVAKLAKREDFTKKNLLVHYESEEGVKKILKALEKSSGAEVQDKDLARVQSLAMLALKLKEERTTLSSYLESVMKKEMPNFSALAGGVLGAKLLRSAGSAERLARMPSSTIQVIGAEKALFAHLKKGTKPPKHGLIFQHPLVRTAKRNVRGRIARTLSNKLALAAREDFYGKKDLSKQWLAELEERSKSLR